VEVRRRCNAAVSIELLTDDGRRIDDQVGVVLPTDEQAEAYAVKVVEELKQDDPDMYGGWRMEVREKKRVVAVVPFYKLH
jgi:hypothetical protein